MARTVREALSQGFPHRHACNSPATPQPRDTPASSRRRRKAASIPSLPPEPWRLKPTNRPAKAIDIWRASHWETPRKPLTSGAGCLKCIQNKKGHPLGRMGHATLTRGAWDTLVPSRSQSVASRRANAALAGGCKRRALSVVTTPASCQSRKRACGAAIRLNRINEKYKKKRAVPYRSENV